MLGLLPHARSSARVYKLGEIPNARKRSFALFCALAGVAVLALALPAVSNARQGRASAARCAGASSATLGAKSFARTMLCLHGRERGRRGIGGLRWNSRLARAAAARAHDMVRRHYFEHKNFMDKIATTGYGGRGCWSAGENLGLAHGPATPRQLMTAWMNSPIHRPNILRQRWHDFGLGMVGTSPAGEPGGLTVVALFGTRSARVCR